MLVSVILLTMFVLSVPNVHAQTTRIYELVHPVHAIAGSLEPVPVTATVYYNDTKPGSSLIVAILDAAHTPQTIVPGFPTSSPDFCINQVPLAICQVHVSGASGAEQMEFKIGGIFGEKNTTGNWTLNMTAELFDANGKPISKSVSTIIFGIELTPATLTVNVPGPVSVTVDGVKEPPGPGATGVTVGQHNIAVPALVQVNSTTRLLFDHWNDGSTESNRTIMVAGDTNFEAIYLTQNLLTILGPQMTSTGAGWYDSTSTATFSVTPTEPMVGLFGALGGELRFQGWYENGTLLTTSPTGLIPMSQSHMVTAVWQADYTIPGLIALAIIVIVVLAFLVIRKRTGKPEKRRSRTRSK